MTLENRMNRVYKFDSRRYVPDAEELSRSGTKGDVGTSEVVDRSLGEHGVVLKLGLAERGAVACDQDKLGWNAIASIDMERKQKDSPSAQGTFSASRSSPRRELQRNGAHPCRCACA